MERLEMEGPKYNFVLCITVTEDYQRKSYQNVLTFNI